jgi:hypothetical protein
MTTISAKSDVVTLINVFTVEPGQPAAACRTSGPGNRGFRGSGAGLCFRQPASQPDGTKVTMYAQWRSIDDYQAMRNDPGPLPVSSGSAGNRQI